MVPQPSELVRIPQKRQHPVPDQAAGRFIARHQQQHECPNELVMGKSVSLFFSGQQSAEKVVLGLLPPERNDLLEVFDDFGGGPLHPLYFFVVEDRFDRQRNIV